MGRYYGAGFLAAPRPVFNASPGQRLPVILDAEPGTIRLAYWGFFVEFPGRSRRMLINARAETVHRHPTFRDSFRCRRCLVVADGFYEWKATATGKQPYRVVPEREGPCTFAGLWKEVEDGPAYVILTAAASPRTSRDPRPDAGDAGPGPAGPVARSRLRDGRAQASCKALHRRRHPVLPSFEAGQQLEKPGARTCRSGVLGSGVSLLQPTFVASAVGPACGRRRREVAM